MSKDIKVMLDEKNFSDLVQGKVLHLPNEDGTTTHIALSDIGFHIMLTLINEAMNS